MPLRDPRNYLFIDGGYLREVMKDFTSTYFEVEDGGIRHKDIGEGYRRVFYYDCPAKADDAVAFDAQFEPIYRLPGWHVFTGVVTGRRRTQKQVDVKIAVDMLSHTLNDNMDSATLLAGDQDFVPVLDALVRAGMYVSLIYEPKSASKELIRVADEAAPLDAQKLYAWCSNEFCNQHKLCTKTEYVSFNVDDRLGMRDTSRWDLIAKGHTTGGRNVRVVRSPSQGFFIVLFEREGSMEDGYLHHDPAAILRFLKIEGLDFDVTERFPSLGDHTWP